MTGPGQRRIRRLGIAKMTRVRRKRVELAARAAIRLKTLVHNLCVWERGRGAMSKVLEVVGRTLCKTVKDSRS